MSGFRYEIDTDKIVTITLAGTEGGAPLGQAFCRDLEALLDKLVKEDVAGVVIAAGSGAFSGGEKARAVLDFPGESRVEVFGAISRIQARLRQLETLGKPVVAVISGQALGVELEICLAAQHRIALNSPEVQIGFPEVNAGLLPGFGGVARTIYTIGLEKGLPLLQEGTSLAPAQALEIGLIHEVADSREEQLVRAKAWIGANPAALQPWDVKGFKIPGGDPTHPRVAQMIMLAPAILRKRQPANMTAMEAILAAAVEAAQVDMNTALRIESRYLVDLIFSSAA